MFGAANLFRRIRNLFAIRRDQPELVIAQARALAWQVPLMYVVVLANAYALAASHLRVAPLWLNIGLPALLTVVCAIRGVGWLKIGRAGVDPERAARMLAGTLKTSGFLAALFAGWSLALYPYGDAYQKAHIAFYMSITVIACIFCLMHLRGAAILVTLVVLGSMVVFFGTTGQPVFQAMAANIVVVSAVMIVILLTQYREFSDLVQSRVTLTQKAEEARRLSDENDRLANLDSLTDLPNRRRYFAELDARVEAARQSGRGFVAGVIDLDDFKPINDAFGHATGDRLLIEVGRRLKAFDGAPILAARLGGDEFGLIIDAALEPDALRVLGRELCASLQATYDLRGVRAQVGASIGFCPFPSGADTSEQLFERADYALYHAKQNGKGAAVVFDERHEAAIRDMAVVEQALRSADLEQEMSVHFQPLVDIVSQRTIALEALARWTSPEIGPIRPDVFIGAAERSGQIVEITRLLVAKALREMRAWPMDVRVSINLSARDIASMENVRRLLAIVSESCIAPHRIDFEITETAIVCDFDQARDALAAFHELGVRTALDDFGTGHSSLSHLRLLPLDKLKIDASFVSDIEHNPTSEDIVRTVLQLGRNLRMECVVEGVETEAQRDRVAALGATVMQGYHFARPMPAEAVPGYLNGEAVSAARRRRGRGAGPDVWDGDFCREAG
ncbi:putative bifunctional diguanylate cyclase/phosphodiesterase [Caulobacter vibrioides]|uniref:GGDEF family protein n=2 Tax=Caulobacter vibrioides TaxID=155892 RepID=Q9A9R6_CAUVC|nr:bifunctional diguanylate cyclase/phosphodiesterase [Caulobacter vibrioides]YP_002516313.1 sensory box GGDEF/EAL protein [Caulobacter vibrioides NA1000]AAK22881.1 GGDEF family protein [Caulobacter vibrioides CB15]ACL94405.1 sensory box GGDEF/EAL protein [Caulobacter vibrioides NA1000]ATC27734.1 bifunctional diguanylate cyclase/phosphodiesterase [Caulobacter vibrioides]QXZ52975.1 bifunctional diguanylate cyclase/phosphodiesterase [Caulobacter vibrioides]